VYREYYKFSESYDINFTLVNDTYYFNIGRKPTDELIKDAGFVFSDITDISLEEAKSGKHKIMKIMFLGNPEIMADFQKENENILKNKYSSVLSQPYVYEILPKGNNKGTGLKKLAKKLGIKQEEIMAIGDGNISLLFANEGSLEVFSANCNKAKAAEVLLERDGLTLKDAVSFGDGLNDYELITETGLGFAMGNSIYLLLEKLTDTEVIESNAEDGMAKKLRELFNL